MTIEAIAADHEHVRATVDEPVEGAVTITIDRPEARNALDGTVRRELTALCGAIDDPEDEEDVRVVVLTGSDESGAFVAGADVEDLRDRDYLEQRRASERPRVYEAVAALRQPVVARINGHALGGGCELALACDVRIAREDATLGQPEIGLGLIPGGGATQRLPRLVGEGQAMRLILTGEIIDAAEAADVGLVDEVCDEDEFDDRIADLAGAMAEKHPVALEYAKQAIRASARMGLEDGIEYEAELFAGLFATGNPQEGIDAFLEDRDPEWKMR
jgi:enoyl-CoA hydratase